MGKWNPEILTLDIFSPSKYFITVTNFNTVTLCFAETEMRFDQLQHVLILAPDTMRNDQVRH